MNRPIDMNSISEKRINLSQLFREAKLTLFTFIRYFCLPEACNNDADKAGIMEHYAYSWKDGREGWRKDYSNASIVCSDGQYTPYILGLVFLAIVALIVLCLVYLMVVPPSLRKANAVQPEDQRYRAVEVLKKMNKADD